LSAATGSAFAPAASARRRAVAGMRLWVAAGLAVMVAVGIGAPASAVAARGRGAPIRVLAPRAGTVIVASNAAGARRIRLGATVAITRPPGGLSVQLNGHPIRLPAVRSGRLGLRLDAGDGLVVGENLLWVSGGRRDGPPSWVVPVRFVVGYRDRHALAGGLRLGAGTLPAATARLRVPRAGVERLRVTLNGARVRLPAGARVLDLAQLGAVHWGINRLRVRLIMFNGRIDDWARTFRLDRRRDVAVAHLNGRAVVGRAAVLSAGRSLIVPGSAGLSDARWVLVHRPRLSHARLGQTRGARVRLRPDVPGRYVIALIVGRGSHRAPAGRKSAITAATSSGTVGYDVQVLSATDPPPLVPLDTIKYKDGNPGVQVGSSFYPDPGRSAVQLLLLDRSTLGLIYNTGLDPSNNFASLASTLAGLNPGVMAIITHPGATASLPSASLPNLDNALRQIGGSLPAPWVFSSPFNGASPGGCWSGATHNCVAGNVGWTRGGLFGNSFTVIGARGLGAGQAWRASALQTGARDGSIDGYLTRATPTATDGSEDYTVINGGADQYASVDTCAGPTCAVRIGVTVSADTSEGSDTLTSVTPTTGYANGATIRGPGIPSATIVSGAGTLTLKISRPATASETAVGLTVNQSYEPGADANGLHVVGLYRSTLAQYINQTVTSTTDLLTALSDAGPAQFVGHYLPPLDGHSLGRVFTDQRLIIIQSVGNGHVTGTATTPLLQYLDELGGTPDLLLQAMTGQPNKYALVGAATNLPWRNTSALESFNKLPAPNNNQAGKISGALEVDRDGLYQPWAGNPISATNTDLPQILYQPPQPWPYAEDTQELSYIARNIGLAAHPDVRSAYLDSGLISSWPNEYRQLNTLTCTDPSLCGPNFDAVKTELLEEFDWVPKVYQLGTNLVAPFSQSGATNVFDIAQVTDQVKNSLPPVSDSSNVAMKWLGILSNVMWLGASFSEGAAASVFGVLASAGGLAGDSIVSPSGGPADKVITTAGVLADHLADQTAAYTQWVGTMERILLYDYGKLSAVGEAVGSEPGWQWQTGITTPQAIKALQASTTASAYSALVPVAWPGYNLTPDFVTQTSSDDVNTLNCGYGIPNGFAFNRALPQNQFHATTSIAANGAGVNQVWTFAKLSGAWNLNVLSARSAEVAGTSLTDYIYGPYAAGHSQNGTWHYGAYQYGPVWWRDTYNPPGHTVCGAQNSGAYPPPNITSPPP
jgi:hypothetical protein